ncbi:hypothetical protein SAMN05421788_106257 [Filimonas lacunae]|uniref:Uncharacterized protein n=1 Tax=Filimonas lacunae TaxID=477680 RepID=A0A173MF86_9BACT|nr:hypothetical protein [Filimonas lacunae]BAV06190.1 hypothetical protein FLA_2206 [Filimonas lacunae]SIT25196.1 hypothetical protein SAMN05421788_106257 [Filimonas lacunae]
MKKYKDFIPHADAELSVYALAYKHNFRKMAEEAISYMNDEAIVQHEAEVQAMIDAIQAVEMKKAELAAAVSHKNKLVQNTTSRMRQMAMFAKKGDARQTATVTGSGLKCNPVHVDVRNLRPQLTVTANKSHVSIAFRKNYSLPIALYSRKQGSLEWEFISYAATSPYIDKRPVAVPGQPESREYQAHYTDFSNCISEMSSIMQVVFHPQHIVEKEE